MKGSLVSCLMPSCRSAEFVNRAIRCFKAQSYEAKELVILRSEEDPNIRHHYSMVPRGIALGELRNIACRIARGSILATWDDDDWSDAGRLAKIVSAIRAGAQLVGSSKVFCVRPATKERWLFDGEKLPGTETARLYGATLAYPRETWESLQFDPWMTSGEDTKFVRLAAKFGKKIVDLNDPDLVWAWHDDANTSPKRDHPAPMYSAAEWIDHEGARL